MEDWQKVQIKSNLSSLLNYTLVNPVFLAILVEEDVLSGFEVAEIKAKATPFKQAEYLYDILLTKSNGYYTLIKALKETNQSGAYNLLSHPTEEISNLKVHFQGRTDELKNLLNAEQITSIQTRLRQNAYTKKEVKALENILKHETEVELLRDTIPKKYAGYIPRFLTRRLQVSAELFKEACSELFVFKEIERTQLRNFVPNELAIEPSTSQLLSSEITARFILLKSESDWKRICKKAKVPVHLLRYDKDTETFVLEKSSGTSNLLRCHLQDACHTECMSEDDFVNKVLSGVVKGVCICDTPGMGKSDLQASLARKVYVCCPESIVAYIQLRDFDFDDNCANLQLKILEHMATSPLASQILFHLLQNETTKFELFFDGLDEVQEKNLEHVTTFLYQVGESMPNARIYVTSRPVVRTQLENAVGVISYDILPFDVETQRNYLTTYWANENNTSDQEKFKEYAEFCLENLRSNLTENDKKITGAPLLCRLVAQVYSDQAAVFADENRSVSEKLTSNFVHSLSEIYSKFIGRQLGDSKCSFACMYKGKIAVCDTLCHVRNFHVESAIGLVCPYLAKDLFIYFNIETAGLNFASVLSPGLLKINPFSKRLEFIHRTYAEYLVAEYFSKSLFRCVETFKTMGISHDRLMSLQALAYDELFIYGYKLIMEDSCIQVSEHVVAYFFNCILTESYNRREQFFTASCIPMKNFFYPATLVCLTHNFKALLDMILGKGTYKRCIRYESPGLISNVWHILDCPSNRLEFMKYLFALPVVALFDALASFVLPGTYLWVTCEIAYTLVKTAAENCNASVVETMCKVFLVGFDRNFLLKMHMNLKESSTLLQIAVKRVDYEMVVYFLNFLTSENQGLLHVCLENTYSEDNELIDKRLDIARLLLLKNGDLLNETWKENGVENEPKSPLLSENLHLKAIKFLIRQGADVNVCSENGQTVLYNAGMYMSINEFVELCQFLLLQSSARCLFLDIRNFETLFSRFPGRQRECEKILNSLKTNEPGEIFKIPALFASQNEES